MKTQESQRIGQKVRELFGRAPGLFRPFTYYDERLDRILVLVKDCSVGEERINRILTVFENNYPEGGKTCVGFAIENWRWFSRRHNLPSNNIVHLLPVLDIIAGEFPDAVAVIDGVVRPIINQFESDIVVLDQSGL